MKKTNRMIVGSAFGLAAIAIAIDHTQHRLPEAVPVTQEQAGISDEDESPCGMDIDSVDSPCSMDSDDSDSSPCGLGD